MGDGGKFFLEKPQEKRGLARAARLAPKEKRAVYHGCFFLPEDQPGPVPVDVLGDELKGELLGG